MVLLNEHGSTSRGSRQVMFRLEVWAFVRKMHGRPAEDLFDGRSCRGEHRRFSQVPVGFLPRFFFQPVSGDYGRPA